MYARIEIHIVITLLCAIYVDSPEMVSVQTTSRIIQVAKCCSVLRYVADEKVSVQTSSRFMLPSKFKSLGTTVTRSCPARSNNVM